MSISTKEILNTDIPAPVSTKMTVPDIPVSISGKTSVSDIPVSASGKMSTVGNDNFSIDALLGSSKMSSNSSNSISSSKMNYSNPMASLLLAHRSSQSTFLNDSSNLRSATFTSPDYLSKSQITSKLMEAPQPSDQSYILRASSEPPPHPLAFSSTLQRSSSRCGSDVSFKSLDIEGEDMVYMDDADVEEQKIIENRLGIKEEEILEDKHGKISEHNNVSTSCPDENISDSGEYLINKVSTSCPDKKILILISTFYFKKNK